jgi:signal transduction histidine kinase
VEVVEDALFIVIRDNGKGILSDGLAPGNDGLSGMRKRLHEFGGTCRIVGNNPGKGTTVEFRLPLRPFFQTRSGGVSVD